jgi:hypothetical protein
MDVVGEEDVAEATEHPVPPAPGLTLDEVKANLASGKFEVVERQGSRYKSPAWKIWGTICDTTDPTGKVNVPGFVKCLTCAEVRIYNVHKGKDVGRIEE